MEMRDMQIQMFTKSNANYISRLKGEPDGPDRRLWESVVVELLKLSLIVGDHLDELEDEEILEFNGMFKIAEIIHDPKYSMEERTRGVEVLRGQIESMKPRYLYLIGMSEEQYAVKRATELSWLNDLQISTKKVVQESAAEEKEELKRNFKIITSTTAPEEQKEEANKSVKPPLMVVEGASSLDPNNELKKHMALLLQKSYENIRLFENKFKKYSDFRHNVKDVSSCFNPLLRKQKVDKMNEHIAKLERYHGAIVELYNNLYTVLKFNTGTATKAELEELDYLLMIYENITLTLKNTIGDYTVATMERRRLSLQDYIIQYNAHIDGLPIGNGDSSKSIFS